MESNLTIGQIAKKAGVGIETIRFYHRKKLLELPSKKRGSVRLYDESSLEKIEFIKKSQSVGFTLSEIKDFLLLRVLPQADCTPVKKKTQIKIKEVEKKINDLNKILIALKKFEALCSGTETTAKCSILDGLKELPRE